MYMLKSWHDNIFHREFYLRYFDKDNVVANNVMFAALYTFKTAMTLLNWTFGTMDHGCIVWIPLKKQSADVIGTLNRSVWTTNINH